MPRLLYLASVEQSTQYRGLVARANYLAQDRADIGFAVKELCRYMSKPRVCDWEALKRLGRYLLGVPRMVVKFDYQERPSCLQVWTDTDHAGCLATRKSTSGGVAMWGAHCIKTWSVNQGYIALSSGEAEYYGAVRGASQALGLTAMLGDLGVEAAVDIAVKPGIELCVDASAAVGIASRRGLGKQRHIELNELWLQDQIARGRIAIRKVDGRVNFSDSLTKFCAADRIIQTIHCTGHYAAIGRHPLMPKLS